MRTEGKREASGSTHRAVKIHGACLKPSGRFPIIVVKEAAETRSCLDRSLHYSNVLIWLNDLAVQSLMISLGVVVSHELIDCRTEMPLAKWNDLV